MDKKKEIDEGIKSGKYMLAEKKNGMHIVTRLRKIDEDSSKFYSILKHLSANMEQNAKDGGNRKWICVQLPELCDEESEAYKAGFKTIAEIGKERIRRAGKKIKEESKNKVDSGFKVFKLNNSNFKIWQGKFENSQSLLESMKEFVDNVKNDSTQDNLLFEIILKSGLDLNVKIEEKRSGENKFYSIDDGKLIVYLGNKITK